MITEHDLKEAIAECQGTRNPNASTCIKLAAFLIIQRELYGTSEQLIPPMIEPEYSYAAMPENDAEKTIDYQSDTEFSQAIDGREANEIWAIIDELMTVLQVTYPRLYAGVMRKIKD